MDWLHHSVHVKHCIRRECTAAWSVPEATLATHQLVYVQRGSGTFVLEKVPLSVSAGDLLFLPCGVSRAARTNPEDPLVLYLVHLALPEEMPPQSPFHTAIGAPPTLLALLDQLSTVWLYQEAGFELASDGLIQLIYHELHQLLIYQNHPYRLDARILASVAFIRTHYAQHITAPQLAQQANLNPVYFGTLFKQQTGYTIKDYLNRIRINHAKQLLEGGEYSVNEVASRCGYNDTFYFSKVFRQQVGVPPSQIKRGNG